MSWVLRVGKGFVETGRVFAVLRFGGNSSGRRGTLEFFAFQQRAAVQTLHELSVLVFGDQLRTRMPAVV